MDEQDGFCTECGAAVSSTDKFCAGCGHQLGDDTPSPSSSQPQTEVDSDTSVEKPEYEEQKDLALSNVSRASEEFWRFSAEVKDIPVEVAPDLSQLREQLWDKYLTIEEALRAAIPFYESDEHAAREISALTNDVTKQMAAIVLYWESEIERRDNAERDRINQAAQKRRADEQAVQYEANAAFFAEKEQEQQARAEQKTPSIGEQIEGRWKQIEGSAAYKQVATAALWISLIIVFLLVVGECGGSGNPYDCRPPMTMSPDGVCWHPG